MGWRSRHRRVCAVEPADPALIAAISASAFATVTPRAEAEVRLERVGGQWLLTDAHHDATPDRALIAFDGNGEVARALVDHYFHYALPLRMAHQVRDLHGALELCVLACPGPLAPVDAVSAELVRAAPILAPGAQVCFRVRNESAEALRVTLVSVAASGRVQHLGDQQIPKHSEYRFWARNELGKPFSMALPPGRREGVDRLVAIGTTALDRDLRYLARATRFVDLVGVRRGPSRGDRDFDDGVADRDSPPVAQWTSALEVVTTRAPGYTP